MNPSSLPVYEGLAKSGVLSRLILNGASIRPCICGGCFGVTDVKILKVAKENNLHKAEDVTHYCKAGGACGACLDDIQHLLDDMWKLEAAKK